MHVLFCPLYPSCEFSEAPSYKGIYHSVQLRPERFGQALAGVTSRVFLKVLDMRDEKEAAHAARSAVRAASCPPRVDPYLRKFRRIRRGAKVCFTRFCLECQDIDTVQGRHISLVPVNSPCRRRIAR